MLEEKKGRVSWLHRTMTLQAAFLLEKIYGAQKVCEKSKGNSRKRL